MTKLAKGESIRQKLLTLSVKRHVKYSSLETTFLIERLVARLMADVSLAKNLVFKGGFVGLIIYDSVRYTVDLDALLLNSSVSKTLNLVKKQAEFDLNDGVWFRFEKEIDLATQGEYGGVRHVYRAGIGAVLKNLKKAQVVHFDLGIGDPVTPGPKKTEIQSLLSKNEALSWLVYPLETIIAEKLHALIAHGDQNSRSKDVYDLAVFLPKANGGILHQALERCFAFRKTVLPSNLSVVIQNIDIVRLQRGWPSAVASVPNAPLFNEAWTLMIGALRQIEKSMNK